MEMLATMKNILFVLLIFFMSFENLALGSDWFTEELDWLDEGGSGGSYPSIAVDSMGAIHISSFNSTLESLQYSTNRSGSWVAKIIDSAEYSGKFSSIAIDGSDYVHISYDNVKHVVHCSEHYFDTSLKYATNASGSWVIETVDFGDNRLGSYSSIALDKSGGVHISYWGVHNGTLKYATNKSGFWELSTVDYAADAGRYQSIGLDSMDNVYISYYDTTSHSYSMKYATNISGIWEVSIIELLQDYPGSYEQSSLAIDNYDNINISYINDDFLKYATNKSGVWESFVIDNFGIHPSLAIDNNNNIHISYADMITDHIKYATNASGIWETFSLADCGISGGNTSIDISDQDKIYISYKYSKESKDVYKSDLKYLTNGSGSWQSIKIESIGDVGRYNSIGVDRVGSLHISYFDRTNEVIKYATNETVAWEKIILDDGGYLGYSYAGASSIAIDSSDKVHIGYFLEIDSENNFINYITNSSGLWEKSIVAQYEYFHHSVGGYPFITLDQLDIPYITYNKSYYWNEFCLCFAMFDPVNEEWVEGLLDCSDDYYLWIDDYAPIVIDRNGYPNVCVQNNWSDDLLHYYAYYGPYYFEIDTYGCVGYYSSINIDIFGDLHVSYFDKSTGSLKYAKGIYDPSDFYEPWKWTTETIDSEEEVGMYTSLAADRYGHIHISYYDFGNHVLKYATNHTGKWITEVACDRFLGAGEYSSITVDYWGTVYISHYGKDGKLLLTKNINDCSDQDDDGFGDPGSLACPQTARDCNDEDPTIYPGATEKIGDCKDSNCNGFDSCFIFIAKSDWGI